MRGLLVTEFTDFEKLTVVDIPSPKIKPKQIRIRVKAASISFANHLVVTGKYQRKPPLPFTPGTECAGEIIECGAEVTRFQPGNRVFSLLDWGAHADEAIAWEVNTYPIPDNLTFAQATNFNSYATSGAAITWPHLLNLKSGQTLLIHGAAGAIGLAAIDIAKIIGAEVIATASTDKKRYAARAQGADHVIDYSTGHFRDEINDITDGKGVNAVLDPVGGKVFDQSLRCLTLEGRICPIGFTSGETAQIQSNILLVKNITVCGLNMGTYYGWSPVDIRYEMENRIRPLMTRIHDWAAKDSINPYVCATYRLSDFKKAMDLVLSRRSIGRVALTMN